jgi:folate-binding protein YgfZ
MLDKYLFAEKVGIEEVSATRALLLLAGPDAPALVKRVAGAVPPEAAWAHVAGAVDGVGVRLVRGAGETGETEVWLLAPADAGDAIVRALLDAGAQPVAAAAAEVLRVEAGSPRFGHEVDASVLLPEIPFADLVSHTKGCYPGQEVVVRIRDRGHVNRHLRGLVLEGDAVPEPGSEVVAGDAAIGAVTSATYSFGLKRPIALAMVRRQHAEPGTAVGVRLGDRVVAATVSALPFRS